MILRELQPYVNAHRRSAAHRADRCELCGLGLPETHRHVVDLERRALCCACRACALLFVEPGGAMPRFRTVPERDTIQVAKRADEQAWSALSIPIRLAFLFFNSKLQHWVAIYPSPAGPIESEITDEAWRTFSKQAPLGEALLPDVEAVLARGEPGRAGVDLFLAPIDLCYELVARVRQSWRGLDGGSETKRAIAAFFERLPAKGHQPTRVGQAATGSLP